MKNAMLSRIQRVAVFFFAVPALQAAVLNFTAGSGTVNPGGDVTIPITANFDYSQKWVSCDMTLQWDNSVLTYKDASGVGVFSSAGISNPESAINTAIFSWFNGSGSTVANGATVFNLTLTAAANAPLGAQTLSFVSSELHQVGFLSLGVVIADPLNSGTINVEAVPEPVNCALAGLACVFIGFKTVRWFSNRRVAP